MLQPTDIARAHAAVDAWAQATNIQAHLPQVGGCSIWWRLRFLLVHEYLPRLLAPPQSVLVRAPSVQVRVPPTSRIFKALIDIGFTGNVGIEYEKSDTEPIIGFADSVGFMRGTLTQLRKR